MAGHAAKFADRFLAHTQQATPIFPKNKRAIIRDAQIQTTLTTMMQDRNFGMFRGQWSTLGKGLSGEPGAEAGKARHWTTVFFLYLYKQRSKIRPRPAQAICFKMKELLRTTTSYLYSHYIQLLLG